MLETLRLIGADLRKKASWYYQSDGLPAQLKALTTDGTAAMLLYRLMQASRRHDLPVLELVFNKMNAANGCFIGRGAEFGPGFVLIHSNGVVTNGCVRGGANITIEHQVTIGAESGPSPTIGDGVYIGAGAKVIGPITVGDRSRVGANAVVLRNVAPDTTVVGIPAKPVTRRSSIVAKAAKHQS